MASPSSPMDYSLQTDVEKPQLVAPPDAMLVLTGGSEVEETQRVEETPASSWHRSMVVIEKYFSRLSENSDIEDDASRAEPGDDHLIDVDPGGMNCGNKAVPAISGRVIAAAAGLTVLGIPLAIGIGVEDCAQLGPRQLRPQRRSILRSIAWNGASAMYEDIVNLARDRAPYAGVRWAWPTASLHERKVVALTFDDAPGDNPAAMHSLLDTLKRYGARATFFCTTDMITSAMEAVMDRIVGEGHELGNHMPKDRVYSLFREAGFERELCHAEETIHRVEQKTAATDAYRTRYDSQTWRRRFKWFRPPFGLMSEAMARVLKRKRYSTALGDVFSNDVFVGGNSADDEENIDLRTTEYHVKYALRLTHPGAITILHVPNSNRRLMAGPICEGYLEAMSSTGYEVCCLSEVAVLAT